jgi:hypothetical protein
MKRAPEKAGIFSRARFPYEEALRAVATGTGMPLLLRLTLLKEGCRVLLKRLFAPGGAEVKGLALILA